ncbi:G-protein beta/gamma-subunit complex binding [Trichomonas vaginalis G3]|nr:G-protein beta/gamma-subunit complex binding [Trichomonas vaginalis G3]KAI5546635.1 G-protein beta/gamma-subunit complex binding [Trichomonas vaginalis G3]
MLEEDVIAFDDDPTNPHLFTKVRGVFACEKRVMLIGPSNSGKTTFLTQLKGMSTPNFGQSDYDNFRSIISDNVVSFLQQTVDAIERKEVEIPPPLRKAVDPYCNIRTSGIDLDTNDIRRLKAIYASQFMQKEMAPLADIQHQHINYIMRNLDALLNPEYQPTLNSMTRVRVRTVGVNRKAFAHGDDIIQVLDCGGARSERGKIHLNTDISKIIFFVSLSDFDLPLYEIDTVNRFDDALEFYQQICQDPLYERCQISLILTHIDKLKDKLQPDGPFIQRFPNFSGNLSDPIECANYIGSTFVSSTTRQVNYYICNLIDSNTTRELIKKLIPFH